MIPGIIPGSISMLLVLFAVAIIVMAILGIFKISLYDRLSTRIIALIFASGLVAAIIPYVFDASFSGAHPFRLRITQIALIALGGPIILGLLTARFVQRPLRQFNSALASLEQKNYKVQ